MKNPSQREQTKARRAMKKAACGKCATPYCRGRCHAKNRTCSKCMMRTWRARYPLKAAYASLRDRAKRRMIEFTLTLAQFEVVCRQSGYLERKGRTKSALQIDRINATLGYTWENCQVITCSENTSKGNHERTNTEDANNPF